MTLGRTIPALPVRDAAAAVAFYRDRLGFEVLHHDGGFAVLRRDDAVVHLWESSDEDWRQRDSLERPVRSGAESFLAGTASCRIEVTDIDALFAGCRPGRAAPVSRGVEPRTSAPGSSRRLDGTCRHRAPDRGRATSPVESSEDAAVLEAW